MALLAPYGSVPTADRWLLLGLVSGLVWTGCRWRARAKDLQSRRAAAEREAAAAQAVYDERLRIARDLHDMVSHGMSVITIQAELGALRAERDPEAAVTALKVVEETGRETLRQLRQMVDVLRVSAGPGSEPPREAHWPRPPASATCPTFWRAPLPVVSRSTTSTVATWTVRPPTSASASTASSRKVSPTCCSTAESAGPGWCCT